MTLTAEERDRIAAQLEQSRERLFLAIANLSAAQWTYQPAPEVWSIAECCDHLGGTERLFLRMVQRGLTEDAARAQAVQGKHKIVHKAVGNRDVRVKVPAEIATFGATGSPREFIPAFTEARDKTLAYVRTTADPLHGCVREHFVLGDFDGAQWLELISAHCLRHVAQIEEVKANAGFPA